MITVDRGTAPPSSGFDSVLSWLDHELRLLEILGYRIDGLTNMLRAQQHRMVCQAASDVDDVRSQLANAAVQRDLVVSELSKRHGRSGVATLAELVEFATESQQMAASAVREQIGHATSAVEAAQARCRLAADVYRPS